MVLKCKEWRSDLPCHRWGSCPPCKRYAVASRPCWWRWRRCPSLPGSSGAGRAALGGKWWRCAARWRSCCWRWRSGRTAWPGWPRSPGSDALCPRIAHWWTEQTVSKNVSLTLDKIVRKKGHQREKKDATRLYSRLLASAKVIKMVWKSRWQIAEQCKELALQWLMPTHTTKLSYTIKCLGESAVLESVSLSSMAFIS